MDITNLVFFDKYGEPLNLRYDSDDGYWKGEIYLYRLSVELFDNQNIFILEYDPGTDSYIFPHDDYIYTQWQDSTNQDIFFTYDVNTDDRDFPYIEKINKKSETIAGSNTDYYDLFNGSANPNPIPPLQYNIAFNPNEEGIFERTLNIFRVNNGDHEQIVQLYFYGEGVSEDIRFKNWLDNFGIKFHKDDALIIKDYDLKEALPDWRQINTKRKELLVTKDEVFPYIGTYKALANFVKIMGFDDALNVKEYWRNTNPESPYNNKLLLADISDMLDTGKIESTNLIQYNKSVKFNESLVKTNMLALAYSFTQQSGEFDDDGLPIVESTTDLNPEQIFYKLNRLSQKLEREILPINVTIRDIIGKFLYFEKLSIRTWNDNVIVNNYQVNSDVDVKTLTPTQSYIYDLKPFFNQSHPDYEFPNFSFNTSDYAPYQAKQRYPISELDTINKAIFDFYDEMKSQSYPDITVKAGWDAGDEPDAPIGCPVVFQIDIPDITWQQLTGTTWYDLSSDITESPSTYLPYFTWQNIKMRNWYEVTWIIRKKSPNPYYFEWTGKLEDLHTIPHFLPYTGTYHVDVKIIDFYGGASYDFNSNQIEVEAPQPHLVAFTNIHDKFNYNWQDLDNIMWQDLEASTWYNPVANIFGDNVDIESNLPDWKYFNRRTLDATILDPDGTYRNWFQSQHPLKHYYGVGGEKESLTWQEFDGATWQDLFYKRYADTTYYTDFLAGFSLFNPLPGDQLKISNYSTYVIPQHNDLQDLVDQLNNSNHTGISLFHYRVLDYYIYAVTRSVTKFSYHYIEHIRSANPNVSPNQYPEYDYTFYQPIWYLSEDIINWLQSTNSNMDVETLFLNAPFSDIASGEVKDFNYWVDRDYIKIENDEQQGHLPSVLDEDPFKTDTLKAFENGFITPKFNTIFFVINSIGGKSEVEWTIYDRTDSETVITIKDIPFLIWRFNESHTYDIEVTITDNKNNTNQLRINRFVNVYEPNDYINLIEQKLDNRIAKPV